MSHLPRSAASRHQHASDRPQSDENYELRIQLLGEFRIAFGEQRVSPSSWRLQKARSLVKLLALAPGHRMHREQVMELLWPDLEQEAAANNLYYALYVARRALTSEQGHPRSAATLLRFKQHVLSLQPAISLWIDVDVFEHAAAAALGSHDVARHQAAIDLYTGDLLPEDRYEDWCISRREALRETYIALLLAAAKLYERQHEYHLAIESLQRAIDADHTREEAHTSLMRLYAVTGQRAQALHQYAQLKETLQRELNVEPEQESQDLYDDILARRLHPQQTQRLQRMQTTPPISRLSDAPISARPEHTLQLMPQPVSSSAPLAPITMLDPPSTLVGRGPECAQIEAVWDGAALLPRFVLLVGEAGIGKTRLAEEALAWAERQHLVTARARCYATAGTLGYAPIAAWLRTAPLWTSLFSLDALWLTEVARVVPEVLVEYPQLPQPGPLAESWQRQRFEQALARALFAGNKPLLLLLDDIQWCDRETLHWLHSICSTHPPAELMIIATLRQEEFVPNHPLHSVLDALRRNGQVTEIVVPPLEEQDTVTLARQLTAHEIDPALAHRIYRETEGNPLFVVETIQTGLLRSEEDTSADSNKDVSKKRTAKNRLPPTVQAVISARLAQLSPTARELAQVAATIGREFAFDLLALVWGKDEDTLLSGIDELWQRRIVREQEGGAYDFSHDKLREVAYSALSNPRRRMLHHRVAQGLEIIHADALDIVSGQVAAHYLQAGEPERAVDHLERAGDYARSIFANIEAERSYRELLRWLEELNRKERAAGAREKLGEILTRTAQYDEALVIIQQAADSYHIAGDKEGEIRALSRIGHVHRWHGTLEAGLALLQPLERSLHTMGLSQRTQSEFYLALAALFRECAFYSEQLVAAQQASICARAVPHAGFEAQALGLRGSALVALGQLEEASRVLEETIPLAEASGDLENLREGLNELAVAYRALGAFDMDRQYTQRALEVSERIGNPSDIAFILHRRGVCAFCMGEWAQARADLDRAEAMVRSIGMSWVSAYPLLGLGLLHLAEGRRDLATRYLEEASVLAQRAGDLQGLRWTQIGLAERDLMEGQPALARDRLDPLGDRSSQQEALVTVFLPLLAWAYTDLGEEEHAEELVEQALTRASTQHIRAAHVDALRSKAHLATRQRRWDVARKALDDALALAATMHYPYTHARVLYEYSLLDAARGDVQQAREHLEGSYAILSHLGERLYATRVEHTLALLGNP